MPNHPSELVIEKGAISSPQCCAYCACAFAFISSITMQPSTVVVESRFTEQCIDSYALIFGQQAELFEFSESQAILVAAEIHAASPESRERRAVHVHTFHQVVDFMVGIQVRLLGRIKSSKKVRFNSPYVVCSEAPPSSAECLSSFFLSYIRRIIPPTQEFHGASQLTGSTYVLQVTTPSCKPIGTHNETPSPPAEDCATRKPPLAGRSRGRANAAFHRFRTFEATYEALSCPLPILTELLTVDFNFYMESDSITFEPTTNRSTS